MEKRESGKFNIPNMMLWVGLFLLLQVGIALSGRFIQMISFNGVLMALQFLACLMLVRRDYRRGVIASAILMIISILAAAALIIAKGVTQPMAGICNMSVYLVVLVMLSRQFRNRDEQAVTDFLTGVRNRRGLHQLLETYVDRQKPFYVIYVDLERFKYINDNYGHTCGDRLMQDITRRMREVVGDDCAIGRFDGDEFVFLLDGDKDPEEYARRILNSIGEKSTIVTNFMKIDAYLSANAGIAKYPEDAKDPETLVKYADIAMTHASKGKRNPICFFDKNMEEDLRRQVELERLIKEGLRKDYFYMVYQPQYKLGDKKLRGFEALLRMQTPDGAIVSPGEFIPVAEKGEQILQIDEYVLRRVMKEFKEVVEKTENMIVSVNISAKNIAGTGFVGKLKEFLDETGFPAKSLEVEITEYCLVQSLETAIKNIISLRELGVQVALDDFGTGYTSLSYLAKMPINLLKVDKSLVDGIETDDKSREFVNAVISMGHMMGCQVLSEGVENEPQLNLLTGQDCDFVQGFVWGRPVDYETAKKMALDC